MASNFPSSLDNFTNPTSTNTLDNPSHSTQHSDINDAVEAIELKLGIGASSAGSATAGQVLGISSAGTSAWTNSISNTSITNGFFSSGSVSSSVFISPEESINIIASGASGTVNVDVVTAGITFATANASANWTLNLRGGTATTLSSLIGVGQSISHVFMNTNGTGTFYPTSFQVDGTAQTIRWQAAGTPSTGNANSIDAYAFTVMKTASTPTYTVLASQTRFA